MAYSPHGSTPGRDYYYYYEDNIHSSSPTPSPHHGFTGTPQRPATRAHFRTSSSGFASGFSSDFSRQPTPSPRFTSSGEYATANVSSARPTRKDSYSGPRPRRERRSSYSYYRTSDHHGDSDEDEFIEINGVTYVLPALSKARRHSRGQHFPTTRSGHDTDYHYYKQGGFTPSRDAGFASSREVPARETREARTPIGHHENNDGRRTSHGHSRRASASIPRPQTARPASSHKKAAAAPAPSTPRKATEQDAKKYRIPIGYSLKNWDPTEQPILLLGSVFDANSLGKWIYDWTVYHHGAGTPIAEVAGELWLLLIQISGKLKRSEEIMPKIRSKENKEMIEDFISSGERLTDKLRKLLKACELPMLRAGKEKKSQLGSNAGVEFVLTLFGRERELERTERFMQSVRLWNLRFDANCEEVLLKPTM